ncbi:hypothetical protein PS2_043516 [Malus domestica]
MAATMDFYSCRSALHSSSDPFRGELMEALEPFMKSVSSSPPSSLPTTTASPSFSSAPLLPSFPFTSYDFLSFPNQPNFYHDGCSTSSMTQVFSDGFFEQQPPSIGLNHLTSSQIHQIQAQIQSQSQPQQPQISWDNYHQQVSQTTSRTLSFLSPKPIPMKQLRGDFARLNFPHLRHNGSVVGGEFGEYKPLHSSVDAKLQAICEGLAETQKQGKSGKPAKRSSAASRQPEPVTLAVKVETSSPVTTDSEGSAGSSPLSGLTFCDSTEPWENSGASESSSVLEKYPSEIDWASILSY